MSDFNDALGMDYLPPSPLDPGLLPGGAPAPAAAPAPAPSPARDVPLKPPAPPAGPAAGGAPAPRAVAGAGCPAHAAGPARRPRSRRRRSAPDSRSAPAAATAGRRDQSQFSVPGGAGRGPELGRAELEQAGLGGLRERRRRRGARRPAMEQSAAGREDQGAACSDRGVEGGRHGRLPSGAGQSARRGRAVAGYAALRLGGGTQI